MKRIFITLTLLFGIGVAAQTGKRGPHNGPVAVAGDYRIETIGCDEYLEIYLYDKFMGPLLNYGITGDVKFFKNDNAGIGAPIVLYGNDGFTAKFPEYYFSYYKVTVNIKDLTISARFNNECTIPN